MTRATSLPPISDLAAAESLSLRALGLLGIALPANENGIIPAQTLRSAEEFLLARQHEDSWLRAFLTEGAWHFTRKQQAIKASARFSAEELQKQSTPPALQWMWQEPDQTILRVNAVRDPVAHRAIAWQLNSADGTILLASENAIADYHLQVAFQDLPEDAKVCAAYGFAAHLALPITGSRSLHDTLRREQIRQAQQLRRLRMSDAKQQVSLKAGTYLQAFNSKGTTDNA